MSDVFPPNPTLKDVAQQAGCSAAVASKVLNGSRGNVMVGKATAERVRAIADRLGYRANFAARSLVARSTRTLGLYIWPGQPFANMSGSYESAILRGVDAVTQQAGYDMLLLNTAGPDPLEHCLAKCREGRFDGLLVVRSPADPQWFSQLVRCMPRVVAFDTTAEAPGLDVAMFDHRAAARAAVEYLAEKGHRRIGFIGNTRVPPDELAVGDFAGYERRTGFLDAVQALGLPHRREWIFDYRWQREAVDAQATDYLQAEGAQAVRWMESLDEPPTALVAGVYRSAFGAVPQWQQMGLAVPGDRSLIGLGDRDWCAYFSPSLTNVANPLTEMGQWAASRLIDRCEQRADDAESMRKFFSPQVVERQSAGPVPESQ
ncbi:LacI family DNA-binding transcriptional regulator [Phycisphaerales bacterium AB-hyl4]|uniref:LacI family DNA-binding transcriptional regulator n=1 Tax=Natronomicrosphaera hydrolytica TaxID=3242702 RepID=A0ABV4U0H3_9BACT